MEPYFIAASNFPANIMINRLTKFSIISCCLLFLFSFSLIAQSETKSPSDKQDEDNLLFKIDEELESKIVLKSDFSRFEKAPLLYRAKIIRTGESDLKVYILDKDNQILDLTNFKNYGIVDISYKNKSSIVIRPTYLRFNKDHYMGKFPTPKRFPFHLTFTFRENDINLMTKIENLEFEEETETKKNK